MIDYYVLPAFFADNTQQAMAMISAAVNGDSKDALAQTPHHFELWQLGEINNQTGNLTANKEFVAECASFIRRSIRGGAGAGDRGNEPPTAGSGQRHPFAGNHAGAANGTGPVHPQGEAETGPETARKAAGAQGVAD